MEGRERAAEFLLARRLLWRKRDGALIEPEWGGPVDKVHYPIRFYDVLSALLVMAETLLLDIGPGSDYACFLNGRVGSYPYNVGGGGDRS